MQVICYVHALDGRFQNTWAIIEEKLSPHVTFELHQTIEDFKDSLKQPSLNVAVVLLYLTDKTRLPELLPLRSVLIDLPLIILMNDQEPEVLKFSHHLRPRVILYSYFGIREVCLVLEKFLARYEKQQAVFPDTYDKSGTIIEQRSTQSCLIS